MCLKKEKGILAICFKPTRTCFFIKYLLTPVVKDAGGHFFITPGKRFNIFDFKGGVLPF